MPVYRGKEFTVFASTQQAHTLTLTGGATFVGTGGAAHTVATFAAANPGEGLRFAVLSNTQVQVVASNGVVFSA